MVERESSQAQSSKRAFCIDCASPQAEDYVLTYFELHGIHPDYDLQNNAWLIKGEVPPDLKTSLNATEIVINNIAPQPPE